MFVFRVREVSEQEEWTCSAGEFLKIRFGCAGAGLVECDWYVARDLDGTFGHYLILLEPFLFSLDYVGYVIALVLNSG